MLLLFSSARENENDDARNDVRNVKHIESNEKNITVSASVVCSEQKLDKKYFVRIGTEPRRHIYIQKLHFFEVN